MAMFIQEELSEYEVMQMENQKIFDDLLNKHLGKPKMIKAFEELKSINSFKTKPKVKVERSHSRDTAFRFFGHIPTERRSSYRLAKIAPVYNFQDADDELEKFQENYRKARKRIGDDLDLDFEYLTEINVNYQIKRKKNSFRLHAPPITMSVDEVSPSYLSNVSYKVSEKTYSDKGTSCHQCRQKTMDSKTVCRNPSCIGVRGQFCGVCLNNRYGESAHVALLDPNWLCPPCREICNCSICRSRKGKRPTGILAPIVRKSGHNNVKDFLNSLKDHEDPDLVNKPPKSTINIGSKDVLNKPSKSTISYEAKKIFKYGEDIKNPVLGFDEKGETLYIGTHLISDDEFLGFQSGLPVYTTKN